MTLTQTRLKNASLENFINKTADPTKTYFVRTGGHFQVVHNRLVYDQLTAREGDPIEEFWGRKKYTTHIYEVS